MAGRLATQCLPPPAVRSIHDRTVVLSPAKPAIAAMPVSRSANAMARAWYLPRSSPGLRDRLPEAAGPDVLPGGPADLDGVAVACEAPLVTRPAGPPALAHPASTTAVTTAVQSPIGSLLIRHSQEQMTLSS